MVVSGSRSELQLLQGRLERARRHAVLPRQLDRIVLQQAVIGERLDRREVALRDVLGALVAANVVVDRVQAQVDADAIERRQVRSRGVQQAATRRASSTRSTTP